MNFIKKSQEGTFCTQLKGSVQCLAMTHEPLYMHLPQICLALCRQVCMCQQAAFERTAVSLCHPDSFSSHLWRRNFRWSQVNLEVCNSILKVQFSTWAWKCAITIACKCLSSKVCMEGATRGRFKGIERWIFLSKSDQSFPCGVKRTLFLQTISPT